VTQQKLKNVLSEGQCSLKLEDVPLASSDAKQQLKCHPAVLQ